MSSLRRPVLSRPARAGDSPVWRSLLIRTCALVVPVALVGALAEAAIAVVAGDLAEAPSPSTLAQFAAVTIVAVVAGLVVALAVRQAAARGEGMLRTSLLRRVFDRPLPDLESDGVGAMLDRVDEDPRTLFDVAARLGTGMVQAALALIVSWLVAGFTWWPAWIVFPIVGALVFVSARRASRGIADKQRAAEEASSDHMAHLEEAVAARDDLRTSLGQRFVLRGFAERAAKVIRLRVVAAKHVATVVLVAELLMSQVAIAVVLGGTAAVLGGALDIGQLVALWILATGFVRHLTSVANLLPQIDAGLGTLSRVRSLLSAPVEPNDGLPLPDSVGPLEIDIAALTFRYDADDGPGFALGPLTLRIAPGTTCALVGRTGSGKTTLTKLLSRAVDPPPGTIRLGGQDVRDTNLDSLRAGVGVVGQRTEILAASLRDNITLLTGVSDDAVDRALDTLGLTAWVASFPDGLDTLLGADGVTLSAGEEQLVAFARLLVRDPRVIVLDEATARMDPATAERVTRASAMLLAGRTGIVVAHRLATARHADTVAVLHDGELVEHGPWATLAAGDGRFARLLTASGLDEPAADEPGDRLGTVSADTTHHVRDDDAHAPARPTNDALPARAASGTAPAATDDEPAPSLARAAAGTLQSQWRRLAVSTPGWFLLSMLGLGGVINGALWAAVVAALDDGRSPWPAAVGVAGAVLASALIKRAIGGLQTAVFADASMRTHQAIVRGQTAQHRIGSAPSGEIAARAQEQWRLVGWSMNLPGLFTSFVSLIILGVVTGSLAAFGIGMAVVVLSAASSITGRRAVSGSAKRAGDARARFGRLLGSALDAARTVKLSAAQHAVVRRLRAVDGSRVSAALREQQIGTLTQFTPIAFVQLATIAAWALHVSGAWTLATTLLVTSAIFGFSNFGGMLGWAITSAPASQRWLAVASGMAGTARLTDLPPDVDLTDGTYRPADPAPTTTAPLDTLAVTGLGAVHDDGTTGVQDVDLTVRAGEVVLVVGQVGSGKSSLLSALAGLTRATGRITWNGEPVTDPEMFLRPPHVAYVGQVPRVVSGTFTENVELDVPGRRAAPAIETAQLSDDVAAAGGPGTRIGHRGLRLSGGQAQRLALARALATDSNLLVIDDVSSALDADTERQLWDTLTARGLTVLGTTSRRATLRRADRVIVLAGGRPVAVGPWTSLEPDWHHLAG